MNTKIVNLNLKCPGCEAHLVEGKWSRHETLVEHVMDPNAEPSLKPEYVCANRYCRYGRSKRIFWDIYGDVFNPPAWWHMLLWKITKYRWPKLPEVKEAIKWEPPKQK